MTIPARSSLTRRGLSAHSHTPLARQVYRAYALLWGVFVALLALLGPKQGRELDMLVIGLAAIGAIAWRIWKGWR